jgi:hypothetical protein
MPAGPQERNTAPATLARTMADCDRESRGIAWISFGI